MFDIKEELKKLPNESGVYIMHDEADNIIYIGKAINLKNRVRQYFQSEKGKTTRIRQMISKITSFEYVVTGSELEALVLECNLIKEHRPKYNTLLKDDKGYPYIKVTIYEEYPRVLFTHQMKRDKSKYFGPYQSKGAVKDTLDIIYKLYKIRTCNRNLPKDIGKNRPCLNYHIKQCEAPCQGYISKEDYNENVSQVMKMLAGKMEPIIHMLEDKMRETSENLEFEKAMEYRDLISGVKSIVQRQRIISDGMEDRDVVGVARDKNDAVVQVFFIREGKMIGREHFRLNIHSDDISSEILSEFIKQFYSGTPFIPKEIFLPEDISDKEILSKWLETKRGRGVRLIVPKKGEKEKLVELAIKNAMEVLTKDKERIKREELKTVGALEQISGWLGIEKLFRVEAFDISNTSGFQSVGSMVVFEKGTPKRNDYRKFKIKTVDGPNDYASMKEVLTRRFEHGIAEKEKLKNTGQNAEFGSFTKFPDIIMMDGGKGQVNIALEVLSELKLSIPVCGMVKDDRHRTRGLYFNNEEIPIDTHSEGFRLITRIQDEAHRFAIEYHRDLRGKNQVRSILDDIKGIGEVRRKSLMRKFRSIENIKSATVDELKEAEGMNEKSAVCVYEFFHGQN
jgi:excinuclease ABC, C subunit